MKDTAGSEHSKDIVNFLQKDEWAAYLILRPLKIIHYLFHESNMLLLGYWIFNNTAQLHCSPKIINGGIGRGEEEGKSRANS